MHAKPQSGSFNTRMLLLEYQSISCCALPSPSNHMRFPHAQVTLERRTCVACRYCPNSAQPNDTGTPLFHSISTPLLKKTLLAPLCCQRMDHGCVCAEVRNSTVSIISIYYAHAVDALQGLRRQSPYVPLRAKLCRWYACMRRTDVLGFFVELILATCLRMPPQMTKLKPSPPKSRRSIRTDRCSLWVCRSEAIIYVATWAGRGSVEKRLFSTESVRLFVVVPSNLCLPTSAHSHTRTHTQAVSIGNPFNLVGLSYWLKYHAKLTQSSMLGSLKQQLVNNQGVLQTHELVDVRRLLKAMSYRELVKRLHFRLHGGNESLDAYMIRSSSHDVVQVCFSSSAALARSRAIRALLKQCPLTKQTTPQHIKVPLLCITASDDPVVHPGMCPYESFHAYVQNNAQRHQPNVEPNSLRHSLTHSQQSLHPAGQDAERRSPGLPRTESFREQHVVRAGLDFPKAHNFANET